MKKLFKIETIHTFKDTYFVEATSASEAKAKVLDEDNPDLFSAVSRHIGTNILGSKVVDFKDVEKWIVRMIKNDNLRQNADYFDVVNIQLEESSKDIEKIVFRNMATSLIINDMPGLTDLQHPNDD